MLHYVYILFSQEIQRFYIGESAFPENRLAEHNTAKYLTASTKIANDWVIIKLIQCKNRTEALKIEQYIKSMKSKKFSEQLVSDVTFFTNFKIIVKQRFNIDIE